MKNKEIIISKTREIIIHILFWVIWCYFTLLRWESNSIVLDELTPISFSSLFIIFSTFYLNYLVFMPRLFQKWHPLKPIAFLLIGLLYFISFRYLIEELIFPYFLHIRNYSDQEAFAFYILDNFYYGLHPIILSTVLWLVIYVIRLLSYHKRIIEENKNTEIKFLKAQLNPHFLFNSLNNIYSLVHFKSDKALPAIDQLGQLMRYSTYNSEKEWISIKEEKTYIESYLKLEALRISEDDCIFFKVEIPNENILIPTFTLIPFIENAFKHGIINKENPLSIELLFKNNKLCYEVKNSVSDKLKDTQAGIGLINIHNRLKHYYPDKHSISCIEDQGSYCARLQIDCE